MICVKGKVTVVTLLVLTIVTLVSDASEEFSDDSEEDVDQCDGEEAIDCAKVLLTGQYLCLHDDVDPVTQQLRGCQLLDTGIGRTTEQCEALEGIVCQGSCNNTFTRETDCHWTNGYHFDTALLLSVFLGMFGADRFYLGYPAVGLLKFSTLGFFFIGHIIDIILIATQTLEPADGSHYVINYFGAGLSKISVSNETYRREQPDWYK